MAWPGFYTVPVRGRRERGTDESYAEARGDKPDQREHGARRGFQVMVLRVVGHHLLLIIYGGEGNYTLPNGRCFSELARGYLKQFRAFRGGWCSLARPSRDKALPGPSSICLPIALGAFAGASLSGLRSSPGSLLIIFHETFDARSNFLFLNK